MVAKPNARVQPRCGAQRSNVGCNPLLHGDARRRRGDSRRKPLKTLRESPFYLCESPCYYLLTNTLTPEQGAQTSVYLATSPDVENVTGKYWEKSRAVPSGRATYDESTWMRLWEVSDKMVAASATRAKADVAQPRQ